MIKLFEQFNNEQEIHDICKLLDIFEYHINHDGSINVNHNVDMCDLNIVDIPIFLNNINGYFDCGSNMLTSLKGCPKILKGYFGCGNNKITSLYGCPEEIDDDFYCYTNKLTTLEGSPKYVKGEFNAFGNTLTTLKGCPLHIGKDLNINNNPINKIDIECDIKGNIYLNSTKLDDKIKNLDQYYLRMLFKHGLDYKIFNEDGSINDVRLQHFLNDFKE